MDIKQFDKGEIIEGQIYSNSGRLWLAKKDVKSSASTPKEGVIWEEVIFSPGRNYRYDVKEIGMKKYRATPVKGAGLKSFEGRDLHKILQICSDSMCKRIEVDAEPTHDGKSIEIKHKSNGQGRGGGNIVAHGIEGVLWNEWNINAWEGAYPVAPIRILGEGTVNLKQWNGDKSLLTVEGGLAIEINGINFEIGDDSIHAVHFKKNAASETSVWRGRIENCYVQSFSTNAEAFRLENFFNMYFNNIEMQCWNHMSFHCVNDSWSTNYGNSTIGTFWGKSPLSKFPTVKFSSLTDNKKIGLFHIDYMVLGSIRGQNFDEKGVELGQGVGAGFEIDGGENISVSKLDIEYQPNPMKLNRSSHNNFDNVYLNTAQKGTAIEMGEHVTDNHFNKVVMHGHESSKLLKDESSFYLSKNTIDKVSIYHLLNIDEVKPSNTKLSNWVRDSDLKSIN